MVSRRLELAFILSGQPFAWRCSLCGRVFVPLGPQATVEELDLIQCEFRQHLCPAVASAVSIEDTAEQHAVPFVPVTQVAK